MKVGWTTARLSTILSTRPSMAVGKPICSGRVSSTLPKTWASGSQRYCRSSALQDADRVDGGGLVDPGVVAQPHALGAAGGARGVDERGELVRAERVDARRRRAGVASSSSSRAQLLELVEA